MSEVPDNFAESDEDQEHQEAHRKMLDEILDEVVEKYGETLRRLGES